MERSSYFGNPWLGMFIKSSDSVSLLPVDAMDKLEEKVKLALKTNVVRFSVAQSNLLGVYLVMNKNGIVVPNVTSEQELAALKAAEIGRAHV